MTGPSTQRLFAELVLPYLDDAYRLSRWMAGNRTDAEDIVQDACVRALAAVGKADVRQGRPWLLTIVRNTALSWLARNRSSKVSQGDDAIENANPVDPTPDPEQALIANIEGDRLRQAIESLPLPFRETLVMREFNDLSYREIADALDVPIGTVMSRLARARGMLLTALQEKGS